MKGGSKGWRLRRILEENFPKLAVHAKLYAEIVTEILVEKNDLMTGASLLRCDEAFLNKEVGIRSVWQSHTSTSLYYS